MLRRVLTLILLAAGGIPLAYTYREISTNPRQIYVIAGIAILAILINFYSLAAARSALKPWLRVLAIVMLVAIAVGMLATRHALLNDTLPSVPKADVALRARIITSARDLMWLCASLGYLAVSIAALPRFRADRGYAKRSPQAKVPADTVRERG